MMTIILTVLIIALLVWAESLLPIDATIVRVLQAVTIILGVLHLAGYAG